MKKFMNVIAITALSFVVSESYAAAVQAPAPAQCVVWINYVNLPDFAYQGYIGDEDSPGHINGSTIRPIVECKVSFDPKIAGAQTQALKDVELCTSNVANETNCQYDGLSGYEVEGVIPSQDVINSISSPR